MHKHFLCCGIHGLVTNMHTPRWSSFAVPQPRVIEVQGRAQALARSMMKVCEVDANGFVWVGLSTKTVWVVCSLLHCKKAGSGFREKNQSAPDRTPPRALKES